MFPPYTSVRKGTDVCFSMHNIFLIANEHWSIIGHWCQSTPKMPHMGKVVLDLWHVQIEGSHWMGLNCNSQFISSPFWLFREALLRLICLERQRHKWLRIYWDVHHSCVTYPSILSFQCRKVKKEHPGTLVLSGVFHIILFLVSFMYMMLVEQHHYHPHPKGQSEVFL